MRDAPHAEFMFGAWHVQWHRQVTSTQDIARAIRKPDVRMVVVADAQTVGRGQFGRRWQSPPGENLLATFVLPTRDVADATMLPLGASLAVCDTLAAEGIRARCKWPNDVMVAGAKIAGVLIEADGSLFRVGIGLNIAWPATRQKLRSTTAWTSMRAETGHAHDRAAVLRALCSHLDVRLVQPAGRIAATYRARWMKPAALRVRAGTLWVGGHARAIGHDGALMVTLDGGTERAVRSSAQVRYS